MRGATEEGAGMRMEFFEETGIETGGGTELMDSGSSGWVDSAFRNSSWGKRAESLE